MNSKAQKNLDYNIPVERHNLDWTDLDEHKLISITNQLTNTYRHVTEL